DAGGRPIVVEDADKTNATTGIQLRDRRQRFMLVAAGETPRCPEVDDDDLPAEIGEAQRVTRLDSATGRPVASANDLEREVGGRLSGKGRWDVARISRHPVAEEGDERHRARGRYCCAPPVH